VIGRAELCRLLAEEEERLRSDDGDFVPDPRLCAVFAELEAAIVIPEEARLRLLRRLGVRATKEPEEPPR